MVISFLSNFLYFPSLDEADSIVKSHFKDDKKVLSVYNQQLQLSDFTDLTSVKKLEFIVKAGYNPPTPPPT